ncbi:MAG: exodeoxyribonuclease VII small subunit [Desulfovibrio sp.]|nr:exodeoxyribonuclease VII small subunit [Desulfovibrio sp.]
MSEELTFEAAMKRLEEITRALEDSALSLEAGLALYKEGSLCARKCRKMLSEARHELEVWGAGEEAQE